MTAIWDEMPPILTNINTHEVGTNPRFLDWLENLKAKITQLHECLGEYHSKQWCDHCIIDSKCAQITLYVQELKDKADRYDMIQEGVPLVHHLTFEQFVNEFQVLTEKLEAVKTFKKEVENNYLLVRSPRVPYILKRLNEILKGEK